MYRVELLLFFPQSKEYERGIRQPAKSTVLLLKLLDRHPELLAEVRLAA